MIEIRFYREQGERVLSIAGHAGFADCGKDIVCAGVSSLTYALLGTLCEAEERGELSEFVHSVKEGEVLIQVRPREEARAKIDAAIGTVLTGYRMIAEAYPQNAGLNPETRREGSG